MIVVELDRESLEYDVQALVRSFFPEEQTAILIPESRQERRAELEDQVRIRVGIREGMAEVFVDESLMAEPGEGCPDHEAGRLTHETGDAVTGCPGFGRGACETGKNVWAMPYRGIEDKKAFKRFFYLILAQVTGKRLPWGNLTGIRPVKIACGMLDEGKDRQEILDFYGKEHFVSDEKSELAVEIAQLEKKILSGIHCEDGYSLYLGIPFCPSTCLYCSFTSYPIGAYRNRTDAYLDCLLREAEAAANQCRGRTLDTVYIGGGTPTTLEPEQLDRLIRGLKSLFDFGTVQEFTVEAGRADSITGEKLAVLQSRGVTRISVNPQTMKQETLDVIGRKASVAQVEEAYALARRMGFDNINMDIILGLPGEGKEDVRCTIDRIRELAPDSLTVHSLAIKRASRLNQWVQENGVSMLSNTDETMAIAAEGAKRLGMAPYYLYRQKNMSGNFENVGYAREGKYGLYNVLIMEEMQSIVALGAGAISKRVFSDGRIERCENVKEVGIYLEKIDEMIERKKQLFEG